MLSLEDKILWLIFSFSTLTVLAGVPAKNYTVRDGLVNNTVRCFYEHPNGELWIGTDGGISIYNGHSFRSLTVKDGLVGNFVWSLAGDSLGGVWLGSYNDGLSYLQNGKITNYKLSDGLTNLRVRTIYYWDSILYIGTDDGLFYYDYQSQLIQQIQVAEESDESFQVMQFLATNNEIWVITRKRGVYKINITSKKRIQLEKLGQGTSLHKFIPVKNNHVLYCSAEGIYKQAQLTSTESLKVLNNIVWDYTIGHNDDIYLASWNVSESAGGLYLYKNDSIISVNEKYGIHSKNLWAVTYLDNHLLVVGSLDKGLYIIDRQLDVFKIKQTPEIKGNFTFKGKTFFFNDNAVYADGGDVVFQLNDVNIKRWLNNRALLDKRLLDSTLTLNSKHNNHLINFIVATNSHVYISTSMGIIQVAEDWQPKVIQQIQIDLFHFIQSTLIYQRPYHEFTIINNYLQGERRRLSLPMGEFTPTDIVHYQQSGDSVIIWTKVKGIFVFAEGKTPYRIMDNSQFCHLKSVSSYQNKALLVNSNDELFSATFSAKGCTIKKIEVPFSYNSIFKVELHDKYRVIHFDEGVYVSDGQQERILNTVNILPDAEIRTVFLSKNSLAISFPEYIIQVPLAFLFKYEIILPKINFVTSLKKIPFDQNSHVISVNKIAVQHPNNYLYYYQVNEQDTIPLAGNEIYLMNLSSGEYSVKVLTYSYLTNTWQTQANYLFSKDKAPWEKLYFWILGLTLIGTFVTIWVYKKKLHSNKRKLEKQAIEKEVLNQKLLAIQAKMNPHFMFNALNSIQNYIIDSDTDNALMYLSEFAKLMRQTVDYSSMSQITLSEEIAFLERYVRIEQMRFTSKIVLEKEIDATALGLTIPPMILQPLVENAFIHGLDTNSTDIQTILLNIKELSPIKLGISVSNPKTNEAVFYPKHNSFGIKSIEQRLKLVNPENRLTVMNKTNDYEIYLEVNSFDKT